MGNADRFKIISCKITLNKLRAALARMSSIWEDMQCYYALNKILNSDWLNTNLTLDYVWLLRSNARQPNLTSGWWRRHVINVIPFRTHC